MRVSGEQSSTRTLHRPTRSAYRGRLTRLEVSEPSCFSTRCAEVVGDGSTPGKRTEHGKIRCVVSDDQLDVRAERPGLWSIALITRRRQSNPRAFFNPRLIDLTIRGKWLSCHALKIPSSFQKCPAKNASSQKSLHALVRSECKNNKRL
jgi:hypothetical protein